MDSVTTVTTHRTMTVERYSHVVEEVHAPEDAPAVNGEHLYSELRGDTAQHDGSIGDHPEPTFADGRIWFKGEGIERGSKRLDDHADARVPGMRPEGPRELTDKEVENVALQAKLLSFEFENHEKGLIISSLSSEVERLRRENANLRPIEPQIDVAAITNLKKQFESLQEYSRIEADRKYRDELHLLSEVARRREEEVKELSELLAIQHSEDREWAIRFQSLEEREASQTESFHRQAAALALERRELQNTIIQLETALSAERARVADNLILLSQLTDRFKEKECEVALYKEQIRGYQSEHTKQGESLARQAVEVEEERRALKSCISVLEASLLNEQSRGERRDKDIRDLETQCAAARQQCDSLATQWSVQREEHEARQELQLQCLDEWGSLAMQFFGKFSASVAVVDTYTGDYPYLGMEVSEDVHVDGRTSGVTVFQTTPGGPAANAGLMEGDLLANVEIHHLSSILKLTDLRRAVERVHPHDRIVFTVRRPKYDEDIFIELRAQGSDTEPKQPEMVPQPHTPETAPRSYLPEAPYLPVPTQRTSNAPLAPALVFNNADVRTPIPLPHASSTSVHHTITTSISVSDFPPAVQHTPAPRSVSPAMQYGVDLYGGRRSPAITFGRSSPIPTAYPPSPQSLEMPYTSRASSPRLLPLNKAVLTPRPSERFARPRPSPANSQTSVRFSNPGYSPSQNEPARYGPSSAESHVISEARYTCASPVTSHQPHEVYHSPKYSPSTEHSPYSPKS